MPENATFAGPHRHVRYFPEYRTSSRLELTDRGMNQLPK